MPPGFALLCAAELACKEIPSFLQQFAKIAFTAPAFLPANASVIPVGPAKIATSALKIPIVCMADALTSPTNVNVLMDTAGLVVMSPFVVRDATQST